MRFFTIALACLALSCHSQKNEGPPAQGAAPGASAQAAAPAQPTAPSSQDRAWIARSNENAKLLLDIEARFTPEGAARQGVTGLDDRVSDFAPGHVARRREATRASLAELQQRLKNEKDPLVAQDLQILVAAAERQIDGSELHERLVVPYYNLTRNFFGSLRSLLDPQVAPERRPAALVRVRKYAGLEGGQPPFVQLAEAETREGLRKNLLPPSKIEVENDLDTTKPLLDGIEKLFQQYRIPGWEQPVKELRRQLEGYQQFVRGEVLARARKDFRLPPELYAFNLRQVGVDIPPEELVKKAKHAFNDYLAQMKEVAARVAEKQHLPTSDYKFVIRLLKMKQIPDDQVLAFYEHRLTEIEDIIRREHLVTLPNRPARIRLGTPAENAQQPAPHMEPPRLIGNTGEQGAFVLPLSLPEVPGKKIEKYDDFNYDAAAWTLTAHEARPGHELQFSRMVETGVSLARAIFAFNSVNVEGWGLYAEAITLPYMPDEGQLISLQLRLQRAARAVLDPELQMGKWTPETARSFLEQEVGLSPAFAKEEVDRFTFRAPGQANAYFYGYTKLLELREAAEKQLGPRFDQQKFHDLILSQGLLPPDLLRKAVLSELR
jgi:uncharacterized protein (DUF885 family)